MSRKKTKEGSVRSGWNYGEVMLNSSNWTKRGVGNAWEWNDVDAVLALASLGPLDTEQAAGTGKLHVLSCKMPVAAKRRSFG